MRFEAAQTAVQIEIKVLLALAGLLQLVGQGLDLAAQAGDFLRLALDLRCQIELRLGLLVTLGAAAYFATLWLSGFRLADFKRRAAE